MSCAQKITQHFEGDWHGDYGAFPAPGHSKSDRGMTVKDVPSAPDGVLIHSFNGGDPLAVKDECRRIGLLPELRLANTRPRETAHYEYVDADGVVLYRTVRIEQDGKRKRFEAQRRDSRGGWIKGVGDVRRVLYRLPDIRAAIGQGVMPVVILAEGERKADKLAGWGFVATSCAFGCKGWRKAYADDLAGCSVVILPDNDDEGREFATKAAADIRRVGSKVHILDLPNLPPKGDIVDWRGSAEDLRALIDATLNPVEAAFPLANLSAWAQSDPQPKSFIMPGFVPTRELTLATGAGGANKSTFGQQLATCVAAGVPMLGVEVVQGAALYVTAEDDEDRLHWMQAHICKAVGVSLSALSGKLHLASLRGRLGNELATFDAEGKLRPSSAFAMLRATIERANARLVVLDNAAHMFAGNENDRQQVTAFVNLLYSLCRDLGVTIILVAHSNKAGDSYSGSTAWLNAVRSQVVLSRPADTPDPDERILTLGKANYARQGQELRFRWHEFALRLDSELSPDMRSELAANAKAAAVNERFLQCLAKTKEERRAVSLSSSASNYAPRVFAKTTLGKGYSDRDYSDALERLLHLGTIANGMPIYQRDNRAWVHGLGLADACTNPCTNHAQSDAQSCTDQHVED